MKPFVAIAVAFVALLPSLRVRAITATTIDKSQIALVSTFSVPFGPRPGNGPLGTGLDHSSPCLPRTEYPPTAADCSANTPDDEWYVYVEFNKDKTYNGAPYGDSYHPGEDWNSKLASGSPPGWGDLGEPVYPIGTGRIIAAGWTSNFGNVVLVVHRSASEDGDLFVSMYAHLDSILVSGCDKCTGGVSSPKLGDEVSVSTQIGTVGNTTGQAGAEYVPHLHLEVRRGSAFLVESPTATGTIVSLREVSNAGTFSPNAWPKSREARVASLPKDRGRHFISAFYCDPSLFIETGICTGDGSATPFFDDFNRPDGPVGNGWIDRAGNAAPSEIENGMLLLPNVGGELGVMRPLPATWSAVRIQATVEGHVNANTNRDNRFDQQVTVFADHLDNGYGLGIHRSDQGVANSSIGVIGGTGTPQVLTPFQFSGKLFLDVTISSDGAITGHASNGVTVFPFGFSADPAISSYSGSNFLWSSGTSASGDITDGPRLDDIGIEVIP